MNDPKKYSAKDIEGIWYQKWMDHNLFRSVPDNREPYTIVIPPPNVTGRLHMGHMLNNTIQDVLIRRARMMGKNACWVPGMDHASIATEAKVVDKLKSEGIDKTSISRDEFLEHAWEWKEKHGGIILEQLKKLGASCDWERTRFTMEPELSDSVIKVFNDLYEKGLIYRGVRMINWDPSAKTALSDEEVYHEEVQSKLYYVNYAIEGSEETVTIATTRPETILGDTAICINPNDKRYAHLKGKKAIVPMINRQIPIIQDDYVDMEFGTGCLKVTPAHDINDYELGIKHDLESIDILTEDGTLNEAAQLFVGTDRFEARELVVKQLEVDGQLVKVEDLTNKVGFSERTKVIIEPRLSLQWFLKMEELAKPALDHVMNDDITFHPAKFKNTYKHWMENIRDWCVSRQLWWGHRIPAWYYGAGINDFVVATSEVLAIEKIKEKTGKDIGKGDIRQDEDVLDTWFSSWLWPISVFNGINEPDGEELAYYYPTNDLVTAPDIIFFWVARMIMAGYEYEEKLPFKNVYFTGLVRDKQGRKMSKSLGNSPDPIDLMDNYGADGVRMGVLLCSPAGNDLPFDESLCLQGRNFANKIWNASRLVKSWDVDDNLDMPESSQLHLNWIENKFHQVLAEINTHLEQFRISAALMSIYRLVWDDFCSTFLEGVKPSFGEKMDAKTYRQTLDMFDLILKIIHPYMPFVSEEIWQQLEQRDENTFLMTADWPEQKSWDEQLLREIELSKEIVSGIRTYRTKYGVANKEQVSLFIKGEGYVAGSMEPFISKQANTESIDYSSEAPEGSYSFMSDTLECFVPMSIAIDIDAEKDKLQKEIAYFQGFLASVDKKLSNERFVQNAPEKVVAIEKDKKADAEAKIKALSAQLEKL